MLELRWDEVDFDAGIITLRETKAGRPQIVVMNAPARQVLKHLQKAKSSEWVLPSTTDASRPLSKTAIENAWQRIRSAAGLTDVRLHDLHHTVGSHAGQTGANAFLVRDLLRHKNLAMIGRYVNRADDPVRTLSDQVGEFIAAAMAGRPPAKVVQFSARVSQLHCRPINGVSVTVSRRSGSLATEVASATNPALFSLGALRGKTSGSASPVLANIWRGVQR